MIWWDDRLPDEQGIHRDLQLGLLAHLGLAFDAVGEDWLRLRMLVDARTHQPFGRLHGGASVALAETVASMAGSLVVDPERFSVVGMEINANHIRPVRSGWVRATASPEALGRSVQVWSVRIEDEASKLVCLSRMTAAVIDRDKR